MARRRELDRAKRLFLAEAEDRDWLEAIGYAKIDRQLGLVISVRRGAKSAASRLVNRLELDVPVTLRAVERAVARPETAPAIAAGQAIEDGESIESLKRAAAARLRADG